MKPGKKSYCCENSRKLYDDYYTRQVGNGLPAFSGSRIQRGHGIGSVLGGLFRSAMPLLKQGAKTIGNQVLKSGMNFANDVISGKDVKRAFKTRSKEATGRLLNKAVNVVNYAPPPPGMRAKAIKRRLKPDAHTTKKVKRRATPRRDIFN